MKAIISGVPGPKIIETRLGWSRTLGNYIEEVWEGYHTGIISLFGNFRGDCDEVNTEGTGAKRRLLVRRSVNEEGDAGELQTEVRLHTNRITKSIFENPAFDDVSVADRKIIKRAIDENDDSEIANLTNANSDILYELLLDKVDSFPIGQQVVTRTVTASGAYSFAAPNAAPNSIYSTAQLIPVLGGLISSDLLPDLDSGDTTKQYGWYYWGAEIISTTGGRKQMVQEWEWGLWDKTLHSFAF